MPNSVAAETGAQGGPRAVAGASPAARRGNAVLDALPGKQPLIKLSFRPPNYETPLDYFRTADHPERRVFRPLPSLRHPGGRRQVEAAVGGEGANGQAELTLDDLKTVARSRSDGGLPVLGQPARLFTAARARRGMGLRRHGLRALEGRRG